MEILCWEREGRVGAGVWMVGVGGLEGGGGWT